MQIAGHISKYAQKRRSAQILARIGTNWHGSVKILPKYPQNSPIYRVSSGTGGRLRRDCFAPASGPVRKVFGKTCIVPKVLRSATEQLPKVLRRTAQEFRMNSGKITGAVPKESRNSPGAVSNTTRSGVEEMPRSVSRPEIAIQVIE